VEISKQTLKDQLAYNEQTEFHKMHAPAPAFVREEPLTPTDEVFDVDQAEIDRVWRGLDGYRAPHKVWEVRMPAVPPIVFGAGVLANMGRAVKRFGVDKWLVVSDPVMKQMGRTDEVQRILDSAGMQSAVCAEVEPDPPIEMIERAGRFYGDNHCGGIVAVGGGSSMDAGKAIALRVSHPGPMTEYEATMGGVGKITSRVPPIVCAPTTSGTGSEVNSYSVVTDPDRNIKFVLVSQHLLPALAVIDPNLASSMPASLTAESGIDALAHCVESYVALGVAYHPHFEALALYGAKLIGRSLRQAHKNPDNIDARTDMSMAAAFGGIALNKGLGIGHAVAHAGGAQHHISHGGAVAVGLLCFVRANRKLCEEQFQDLAWALDRSHDLEKALLKLYADLGIASRYSDLGVPREAFKRIAFAASREVATMAGNPVPMDENKILALLD
jgi:alcohol dehydrogenase class IV